MQQQRAFRTGLEVCISNPPRSLRGARLGLLTHQAAVDANFRMAHEVIAQAFEGQLRALFSPQHGLWSDAQDNMVETPHTREARLRIPVFSLYADSRVPTGEMLSNLDVLLVDLQDVGVRVYTYIWTLSYCLEVCGELGLPMIILDRPNPLGGILVEGQRLNPAYSSFVGRASIPMRHGLTIGEMALYLNHALKSDADVSVIKLDGWQRQMEFPDTQRGWIPPSPNLPRMESIYSYPGQVLVEGTNLTEGRGTTTPFELVGAPFVEPTRLIQQVNSWNLPGVRFRPIHFKPTFQKWCDRDCGGLFIHVVDAQRYRPVRTAIVILDAIRWLWPEGPDHDGFQWRDPPYEYETRRMPIDILFGDDRLRRAIDQGLTRSSLDSLCAVDEHAWWEEVRERLLY